MLKLLWLINALKLMLNNLQITTEVESFQNIKVSKTYRRLHLL